MAQALVREQLWEGVAFHAQQAAEKALKALAVRQGVDSHTHSCTWLADGLTERGVDTSAVKVCCQKLDQHYTASRYPNGAGGAPERFYSRELVEELLACSEAIREFVKDKI